VSLKIGYQNVKGGAHTFHNFVVFQIKSQSTEVQHQQFQPGTWSDVTMNDIVLHAMIDCAQKMESNRETHMFGHQISFCWKT
jgi:hypothetical protein